MLELISNETLEFVCSPNGLSISFPTGKESSEEQEKLMSVPALMLAAASYYNTIIPPADILPRFLGGVIRNVSFEPCIESEDLAEGFEVVLDMSENHPARFVWLYSNEFYEDRGVQSKIELALSYVDSAFEEAVFPLVSIRFEGPEEGESMEIGELVAESVELQGANFFSGEDLDAFLTELQEIVKSIQAHLEGRPSSTSIEAFFGK